MYYNLSMYFPVDGLLWLVVIFLLFQKCWGWHSWTFSGAELVRSRAVTLFSFIRFWETPHHSLSPTPPHHSADHLPSTPLQYSVLSGSFFGWSDGSETCLSVDAVEVKHLFKGLLTICFMPDIFLIWRLSSLSWGILPEVCLFYDLLKELVSVFVRASYFQLLYRVISFCS